MPNFFALHILINMKEFCPSSTGCIARIIYGTFDCSFSAEMALCSY